MAFRRFAYHPDAEEGLMTLLSRGENTFAELKRRIRFVQQEWEPEDESDPEFVVPFENFFLTFTAAKEDASVLVLAAVDPQPQG